MAARLLAGWSLCVAGAAAIAASHLGWGDDDDHPAADSRPIPTSLLESGQHQLATKDMDEATILQRMQYWSQQPRPLNSTDKYLLFTIDHGGLNNIRIALELTGVVARRTGRTLVLPPTAPMYLLDFGPWNKALVGDFSHWSRTTLLEELINLKQLKSVLPTLTAAEFEKETGVKWNKARIQSQGREKISDNTICHFEDWEKVTHRFLYMDGFKREPFDCSEWFLRGGPRSQLRQDMTDADWALLRHGFVWHNDAFEIAAKVIRYLGLFEYVAVHARYGDFAEKQSERSADDIYENWKTLMDNATATYVATDRQERFIGFTQRHNVKLIMWPDLFKETTGGLLVETRKKYSPERWYKLIGLVEELICTYSKVFIGTDRSSFTGHIERMRLHADAPVKMHLVHTDGSPFKRQGEQREVRVPLEQIENQIDEWQQTPWKVAPVTHGEAFVEKRPGDLALVESEVQERA